MLIPVSDSNDENVDRFRSLMGHRSDRSFVGEGRWVVERMMAANLEMEAVLLKESLSEEFVGRVDPTVPVFAAAKPVIDSIVGFEFHRGVIAIGRRPIMGSVLQWPAEQNPGELAVGLMEVSDPENVGNLLRSSAAFGVHEIVVGRGTADPYRRRVIRVSMGSIFTQRLFWTDDWLSDLACLQKSGVMVIATTLDKDVLPVMDPRVATRLDQASGRPMLLLLGSESKGLPDEVQRLADLCVRIPMAEGIDSLNVASAGTVALYELMRKRLTTQQSGSA